MNRPRVIMAEKDENYLLPLQTKFIDEYFDALDLEVITEEAYFAELFTAPQTVDILIVNKEWYRADLKRHNIRHLFVLTEQNEAGETDDLSINKLFKYTSIKEIFNEIVGNSRDVFQEQTGKSQDCQLVLVYSANGGSGKTTTALGVCSCLAQAHKRVLYIDAEYLQTFQRLMQNRTPISATDVYAKMANADERIYQDIKHVIRKEEFHYLPPFKAALLSTGIPYAAYESLAKAARDSKEYDYIVMDTESVFSEEKLRLLNMADKVLIITGQSEASVYATSTLTDSIHGIESDKYYFICNDFDKNRENALIANHQHMKFSIDEYIEHMEAYEHISCKDLKKSSGIQKIAFLIM